MKAKFFIPQSWKNQWMKPMINLFDYVPTKYNANEREKQIRKFIWDFKDGKRSKAAACLVAQKIAEKFGSFAENLVLVCIPASSAEKTEVRYKEFSAEVSRLCGCTDGYNFVHVDGNRLAIHESKQGKHVENTEVITFNSSFFNGKRVLLFDDILTQGHSYARFACALENLGAEVVGGYFLGKTVFGYTDNNRYN